MRTLLLAAACLAAGFFLGTWTTDRLPAERVEAVRSPDAPLRRDELKAPHLVGREAPVARPFSPSPPPPEATAPPDAPGVAPAPTDPRIVARLEVHVPLPPGAFSLGGTVYALPAGSPGVQDCELVPHADLDAETVVIPLPGAGHWDVGYAGHLGEARVEDVRVTAGTTVPVRLILPRQAPITFFFEDADAAAWARGREPSVLVRSNRAKNAKRFPGLGEGGTLGWTLGLSTAHSIKLPPVPADREYELTLRYKSTVKAGGASNVSRRKGWPNWKLRLERDRVRAGAEVGLVLVEQATLLVVFSLRGRTAHPWPKELGLPVRVHLERGGRSLGGHTWGRVEIRGATELRSNTTFLRADPGSASLVWDGASCLPGRLDGIDLVAGELVRIEAAIDLDPEFRYVPGGEAPTARLRVRIDGERSPHREAELTIYAADPLRGPVAQLQHLEIPSVWPDVAKSAEIIDLPDEEWAGVGFLAATDGPDRATRPIPVDGVTGVIDLRLEPAGLLAVVPTWWSSNRLGQLCLRMADGTPMVASVWSDGGTSPEPYGVWAVVAATPGKLIGPLVPGDYEFDVLLGTTCVGRVRGTVRAGRVEILRLPR